MSIINPVYRLVFKSMTEDKKVTKSFLPTTIKKGCRNLILQQKNIYKASKKIKKNRKNLRHVECQFKSNRNYRSKNYL
jgi:hypothetical protein